MRLRSSSMYVCCQEPAFSRMNDNDRICYRPGDIGRGMQT